MVQARSPGLCKGTGEDSIAVEFDLACRRIAMH
jgi:hypothetical protein